jgi:hypothetical protein
MVKMAKGALIVLLLIILVGLAVGVLMSGVTAEGGGKENLGLSFGALLIFIFVVFTLALYIGSDRRPRY